MNYYACILFLVIGMNTFSQKKHEYPNAPKESLTEIYFEDTLVAPYQWMENPDDPRLKKWLEEQKDLTKKRSSRQTHYYQLRDQIAMMYRVRREKTDDYEEPDEKLEDKFDFKQDWNSYTQSYDQLYRLNGKKNWKRLFKGKDLLKNEDDHLLIRDLAVNEEENLVAVKISFNGSDWATGYIYDLTTGEQLPYIIKHIRTGTNLEWDGRSLYYDAYNKPKDGEALLATAKGQKLYKLAVDMNQAQPEVLYKNPDTSGVNSFRFDIKDERLRLYHFLRSKEKWFRAISVANLAEESFRPQRFLVYPSEEGMKLSVVHTKKDSIFLQTTIGAPNGKVLLANLKEPNQLTEFIPEYDIDLKYVRKLGKNKLAGIYLKDGQNFALIFNMKGKLLRKIDFPKGKKVNHFYENSDLATATKFSISSFFHPRTWYEITFDDLQFKPIESLSVPYDIHDLETRYVSFNSKDGTEIPMYITCSKETVLDGTNPVLIRAYGGYGNTIEPSFQESTGLLLSHGGILAVPNVRGGGAKGEDWALAGRRLKKQNTIDDFIAAAEYLVDKKYTNPDRLVITGASHGGLLVAAASTQRPDLFKAVIAEAGPYDMLRFNNFTAGGVAINLNEFGDVKNLEDYKNLRSYSPLHQLKNGAKYPNTLLLTGDTDDRVPPLHTYKYLARLQEVGDASGFYHMYLTPGSGHGGALTQEDWAEKLIYKYYFLFDQLDIEFY